MNHDLNRRELLKAGALAGGAGLAFGPGALLGRARAMQPATPATPPGRKRVLRLAHLTDMHIQPERHAAEGVAKCLEHVQSRPDKPDLILTGGDHVMDAFEHDAARTTLQWGLWSNALKDNCSLPVESCIGNHDIWGWNKKKSGATGEEGNWGKRWAMDALKLDKPYRTFDKAGWRFVVLDTVFPHGDGYIGRLDDEQFAWLETTLKETPATTPILVLSHIPILTITVFMHPKEPVVSKHEGSNSLMMADMPRITRLFDRHRNVKACISGHIHELDRVDFQGVTYLCNGAVCGSWWKGKQYDCPEGYAMVDLYDDGTVDREYVPYGWMARE